MYKKRPSLPRFPLQYQHQYTISSNYRIYSKITQNHSLIVEWGCGTQGLYDMQGGEAKYAQTSPQTNQSEVVRVNLMWKRQWLLEKELTGNLKVVQPIKSRL